MSAMQEAAMNRRDMLKETAVVILASQLPGLAAAEPDARTPALDPLPDYLANYRLPEGEANDPQRAQTLTFDLVEWRVGPKRITVTNAVIGSLTVKRVPEPDRTVYQTVRTIDGVETLTGEFVCANDPWRSLREWRLQHVLHRAGTPSQRELVATRQLGKADGKGYELTRDGGVHKQSLAGPLACQCGLMDALPALSLPTQPGLALVEGASGVRINQHFQTQGAEAVAGEKVRSILQTGDATLPTHWVVDGQGRPLFITTFLLSLALVRIG